MPVVTLAAALLAAAAPVAQDADATLAAAIGKAGARHEPIVLPEDKALIARKCGYAADWDGRNVNFTSGTLICENGKRVADSETRALEVRISRRARAYAKAIMADPEVKRAIDRVARDATGKALAKLEAD